MPLNYLTPFTFADADAQLAYNPLTGTLTWKIDLNRGRIKAGSVAGSIVSGRRVVRVRPLSQTTGRGFLATASRVAYLLMTGEWPVAHVDHENLDSLDNRWDNLRAASHKQNNWNRGPATGKRYKGTVAAPHGFVAYIGARPTTYLGSFADEDAAARAYDAAAVQRYGEFAYLNFPQEHRRERTAVQPTGVGDGLLSDGGQGG